VLPRRLAYQVMISSGLLKVPETPIFYSLYSQADVALSMRIHSMSRALGLGTPFVALVSQSRMAEFLSNVGLENLGVDILTQNWWTASMNLSNTVSRTVTSSGIGPGSYRLECASRRGRLTGGWPRWYRGKDSRTIEPRGESATESYSAAIVSQTHGDEQICLFPY